MAGETTFSSLHVVLAANENYFPGLLITATSAALSCAETTELHLYVLDGGISDRSWRRLASRLAWLHPRCRLERLAVHRSPIFGIEDNRQKSPMAYARLLAPALIPVERIVYVDSDCLILGDLSALASIDLGGAPCGAVQDPIQPRLSHDCPWLTTAESDGLPYFNSGLLVIDIALWRESCVSERALELLHREASRCRYWDQTALNFVLRRSWRLLPPEWNFPSNQFDHSASVPVRVIHFLCHEKPWFGDTDDDAHAFWRRFASAIAAFSLHELHAGVWRDRCRIAFANHAAGWLARWFAFKQRQHATRGETDAARAAGWAQRYWEERYARRGARRSHARALSVDLARRTAAWQHLAASRLAGIGSGPAGVDQAP